MHAIRLKACDAFITDFNLFSIVWIHTCSNEGFTFSTFRLIPMLLLFSTRYFHDSFLAFTSSAVVTFSFVRSLAPFLYHPLLLSRPSSPEISEWMNPRWQGAQSGPGEPARAIIDNQTMQNICFLYGHHHRPAWQQTKGRCPVGRPGPSLSISLACNLHRSHAHAIVDKKNRASLPPHKRSYRDIFCSRHYASFSSWWAFMLSRAS